MIATLLNLNYAGLGLVFLLAGISKIWDPMGFYWSTFSYIEALILGETLKYKVAFASLFLAPFECVLGLVFLCRWQTIVTTWLGLGLTSVFAVLALRAWMVGYEGSCACFGDIIERDSEEAAIGNSVLFLSAVIAFVHVRLTPFADKMRARWMLPTIALVIILGGGRILMDIDRLKESDLRVGTSLGDLLLEGSKIDLNDGDYLIEIFSPSCPHCQQSVPQLNSLVDGGEVPEILALTSYKLDSAEMVNFMQHYRPIYAIATITVRDFYRLTWRHKLPRFVYVKDGIVHLVAKDRQKPDEFGAELIGSNMD